MKILILVTHFSVKNTYILLQHTIIIIQMVKQLLGKRKSPNQQQTQAYDKITKIETDILKRVQKLKLLPKVSSCPHLISNQSQQPYDKKSNYYDLFWKRFLLNELGKSQIVKIKDQILYFSKRLQKIESLFNERAELILPYQRSRQKKEDESQISKYPCSLCSRSYCDKQILILHQQIVHSGGTSNKPKKANLQNIYEQSQNNEQLV